MVANAVCVSQHTCVFRRCKMREEQHSAQAQLLPKTFAAEFGMEGKVGRFVLQRLRHLRGFQVIFHQRHRSDTHLALTQNVKAPFQVLPTVELRVKRVFQEYLTAEHHRPGTNAEMVEKVVVDRIAHNTLTAIVASLRHLVARNTEIVTTVDMCLRISLSEIS